MDNQQQIKEIQNSEHFFRILEVGAGMPISNEIFKYEGASKIIYSAESYYSKDAFEDRFGLSNARSVSAEHLQHILYNVDVIADLQANVYNSLIATSFQLGEKISNHGWILVHTKYKTRYYHISFNYFPSREFLINEIRDIGLFLVHTHIFGNDNQSQWGNVDIILDENLNPVVDEVLESISRSEQYDICSIFTPQGTIERLEYITRDVDNLILYKGSFNPISISHQELMEKSIKHYTGTKYKAVFCLSFNTFEKGKQSISSFKNRIKYITKLGYCVLVNNNPLFKDLNQLIRYKFSGNLVFVAGADTMNRLVLDFIAFGGKYPDDIKEPKYQPFIYENHFKTYVYNKPVFLTFNRGNVEWHPDVMNIPRIKIINHKEKNISSTDIRKALADKDFDKVKTLVPFEIYDDLITDFIY